MDGKVCVVTGASGAIGRETVAELARRGATVVMLCHTRERGERARDELAAATGAGDRLEVAAADLASQADVRRAAGEVVARHPQLHALVNNAGVILRHREETADGIERTFATNYLGHFLLTQLLLDALQAGAPSRIVNVASVTGRYSIDFDDVELRRKYSAMTAGSQSKLALVLFTVELARRLEGTGVCVNAMHPGLVKSGVARDLSPAVRVFLRLISGKPEKGARVAVHLAAETDVTGRLFGPGPKEVALPAQAKDAAARTRLWELSERLVGPPSR
jgi:NAD(P)-dependent dehydrogenase (short-subunit alcohol dehydrogenase family)